MFIWSPGMTLEFLEKASIQQAMKFYQGNKTLTSRALGCAINTLNSKLERYAQEDRDARVREDKEQRERDEQLRRARGFVPGTGFPTVDPITQRQAIANAIDKPDAENARPTANGIATGLRMEPAAVTPPKSSLPMQERKEVQSVLPKSTSSGSKKGRG